MDSTYSFQTSTIDPEEDSISYQFDWGDGTYSEWSEYISSGDSINMEHSYSSEGTYGVKSKAKDVEENESSWSSGHSITITFSNRSPITPPEPSGPDSGFVDSTYNFITTTTDPDGDSISYQFDWGDGTYSEWSDYTPSGDTLSMDHSYSSEGTYSVKVTAKDEEEVESGWSIGHSIAISEISPGDKIWSFETGGAVISSPAIGDDGTIYIGSGDYYVYAINPDGTKKWSFRTSGSVSSSPAIGSDGTIYVGSSDNNLYAINPDGTEEWTFSTGNVIAYASPAIGGDGTIYAGSTGIVYAISPDGTEKWAFTTGDHVPAPPAIGADGTIYVACNDRLIYAINPDGTEKWTFLMGENTFACPAIGPNGTIYLGSFDNNLYAILGSSGGLANTAWPMFLHDLRHSGRVGGP